MERINREHPDFRGEISKGNLHPLRSHLREILYRHGAKYTPLEMWNRISGEKEYTAEPYLRYLTGKYLSE